VVPDADQGSVPPSQRSCHVPGAGRACQQGIEELGPTDLDEPVPLRVSHSREYSWGTTSSQTRLRSSGTGIFFAFVRFFGDFGRFLSTAFVTSGFAAVFRAHCTPPSASALRMAVPLMNTARSCGALARTSALPSPASPRTSTTRRSGSPCSPSRDRSAGQSSVKIWRFSIPSRPATLVSWGSVDGQGVGIFEITEPLTRGLDRRQATVASAPCRSGVQTSSSSRRSRVVPRSGSNVDGAAQRRFRNAGIFPASHVGEMTETVTSLG